MLKRIRKGMKRGWVGRGGKGVDGMVGVVLGFCSGLGAGHGVLLWMRARAGAYCGDFRGQTGYLGGSGWMGIR